MFRSLRGTVCVPLRLLQTTIYFQLVMYGIPVIHFQQIKFPQSKELVYLPVLIFDRRNESDLRGDGPWRKR
jgi:hypothetical protein